ncbi:MAG: DUF2341 domain-containing protein [Ferruginibacter sp.]|nr:DUF2341 domain-containing protein [Ferruginibacter sp.]
MITYLKIIKKSALTWFFEIDNIASSLRTISDFEVNIGTSFNIVELDGSNISVNDIENVTVVDETTGITFVNTPDPVVLEQRLRSLDFVPFRDQNSGNGGDSGIIDAPAIAGTGNTVLTFDKVRYHGITAQTGNISLTLANTGNKNGRVQVVDIDGDGLSSLIFPNNWINSNGVSFDPIKNNIIDLDYVNGKVKYNISRIGSIPGFNYRKNIIIDNSGLNEQLNDVQIKVILNATNFDFTKAKPDGSDIRFYKGNQELNYYKESYNSASESAIFYVKTNVSSDSIDNIQLYYGNVLLSNTSSWEQTMDRFKPNLYGGNTKFLLSFDEGTGTSLINSGSSGGNITVQNNWASQNNYGFSGSALNFNGSNQNVNISGLLDSYPDAGEISFSFIARGLSGNKRLLSKFNRLGTADPDYGDYFNVFINANEGNKLQLITDTSAGDTRVVSNTEILINTLYKVTIIWGNGAIGLYVNGILEGRGIFYKVNGSQTPFKIGSFSDPFTGNSNLFFDGTINDFRYTDYTNGQIPSLVHVEAEHNLNKFYPKDKRTKFNAKKDMIITNFPTGNVTNYKAEPLGIFENGLFKLWYSAGDSYIHYRESTTSLGLKTATDQIVLGAGIGGETGDPSVFSILIENGIYYLYYSLSSFDTSTFLVTSTDGINFANKATALQKPATGWGSLGLVNTWVVKVNSVYQMFVESRQNNNFAYWSIGRATSNFPNGPFLIQEGPINAFNINGTGSSGGPTGWFDGVKFNMFYHANPAPVTNYDQIYFTSTIDFVNYATEQVPTMKIHDDITAFDQSADVNIFSHSGKIYFDYSALDNGTPFFAGIIRCEFNGTYDQLKKDFTITIGVEQTNN